MAWCGAKPRSKRSVRNFVLVRRRVSTTFVAWHLSQPPTGGTIRERGSFVPGARASTGGPHARFDPIGGPVGRGASCHTANRGRAKFRKGVLPAEPDRRAELL